MRLCDMDRQAMNDKIGLGGWTGFQKDGSLSNRCKLCDVEFGYSQYLVAHLLKDHRRAHKEIVELYCA